MWAAAWPIVALLTGCSVSPAYYWQAAGGQFELWRRAQPVERVIADPATPEKLRERLTLTQRIRAFAVTDLALPDGDSYRRYADLKRPYVLWNVFAAPPLSMDLHQWCLPVAGCVGYLGFFDKADAEARAAALRAQGLDVYVGGVPAYSTLGWFDDPLLNTFIGWPETELARLIFHELAHRKFYLKGDTAFNESYATAVEEEGVRRWMAQPGKAGLVASFERAQRMRDDFAALILKYRDALGQLYASDLPEADKLQRKQAIIAAMRDEYARIKVNRWNGFAGYDHWFGQDINNAALASVGLYRRWVPAFTALLHQEGDDMPRFFAAVKALAALPEAERERRLLALTPAASTPDALASQPQR